MEPATPAIMYKNTGSEKFEIKIEKLINNYNIHIGIQQDMNNLVIKVIQEKTKHLYFYQGQYTLSDLKNLSRGFNFYESIEDLISDFPELTNIEEKNEECIILLKLFSAKGEELLNELILQKYHKNKENEIKRLSDEIKQLKSIINQKDTKINELTKEVSDKNNQIIFLKSSIENTNNKQMLMSNQQIINLQQENNNLKAYNSNLQQTNNKLQTMNNNLNNRLKQLDNIQYSYNQLLSNYNKLKENFRQLTIKNESLESEFKKNSININQNEDISKILSSMDELNFINFYAKNNDPSFNFKNIKLLYRSSRDGDTTKKCHELCDNKKNVLIIMKSDRELIFGGYSKIGFKATNKSEYLTDNNSFLFSVDLKKIFPAIKDKNHISHISDYCGLCFTGSLCFFDNFMHNNDNCIYSSSIKEYFNRLDDPCEMNGGKEKFKCKELEVYQFI